MAANTHPIAPFIGISRHRLLIDGTGVTTLAAFHGCPLRCRYCLNPHCRQPQAEKTWYTPQQLYEQVKIDELYFLATQGGITFGGGEPYLYSDFIREFRTLCGEAWRITVETSLHIPRQHLMGLLPIIDDYIIDIKDMNPAIYRAYTGKSNRQVIQNLQWLVAQGKVPHMSLRLPLIPHFNTEADREHSQLQLQQMGLTNFDYFTYLT